MPDSSPREWVLRPTGHGPDDLSIYPEPEWLPDKDPHALAAMDRWQTVTVIEKSAYNEALDLLTEACDVLGERPAAHEGGIPLYTKIAALLRANGRLG